MSDLPWAEGVLGKTDEAAALERIAAAFERIAAVLEDVTDRGRVNVQVHE